jgi:hypothetical protein
MPKSAEFHQKMIEGWETAKEAKAQRRAQNRAVWANSPRNAAAARGIAAEIPVEPVEDSNGSGSLTALRKIMGDVAAPLHRRIDAAETVISFELAPGAAANVEPDLVASVSYKFLQNVVASPDTPDALRFKALRLLASVENQRAQLRSTSASLHAKRELLVGLCNAQRRALMFEAGRWPPPVGARWALTLADDITWPEGWPGMWSWPPDTSMAAAYSSPGDVIRTHFGTIRARNRVDDFDRILHEGG